MKPGPRKTTWPPLITDAARPHWILWRDRVLTLLVWLLFAALFIEQSIAFAERISLYRADPHGDWDFLLRPFFITAGILVLWLVLSGMGTYRRALRHRQKPPPPPLALAEEAAHLGVTSDELLAARQEQVIAVTISPDGRFRFDAAGPICTAAAGGKDRPGQLPQGR